MEINEIENIKELNDKRTKDEIVKNAISELKFSKNTLIQNIGCIVVSCMLSFFAAFRSNTVIVSKNSFEMFLTIDLAFIAMILGSYAVFQALMRDEIILQLIKDKNNILKKSNRTFVNLSIIYIVIILVTAILIIITNMICEDMILFNCIFSDICCFVMLSIYYSFNSILIFENINFVINLYRMFNVYNSYRALEMLEKDKNYKI